MAMESENAENPTIVSAPAGHEPMLRTIAQLFPNAEVEFARSFRPAQHEFRFFPTARWPNLVLPVRPARAAAHTARRFSTADRPIEILTRAGAAGILRVGAGRMAKDRILVSGATDSVLTHLSAVFGRQVTASVAIGTARANRKPVLEVFDGRGRTLGFAKVGIDPNSRGHVASEAKALGQLAGRVPVGMAVPSVIDVSSWRDNLVLVMSAFTTRPQRLGARARVPADLMAHFSRQFSNTHQTLASSPFWHAQIAVCGSLRPDELSYRLSTAIQEVHARWGDSRCETGAWHGDWTPWNMAWRGSTLQVWDLERFDEYGLVGLDLVHFVVNERMQVKGVSSATVLAASQLAPTLAGHRAESAAALSASYLVAIALRYLASADDAAGSLARIRAALMVESLESLLDLSRNGRSCDA